MGVDANSLRLSGCRVVTTSSITSPTTVEVLHGQIATIGEPHTSEALALDLDGLTLLPGFIDLHIHGAGGYDAHAGEIDELAAYLPRAGVTAFLPTLAAGPPGETAHALRAIQVTTQHQRKGATSPGATVLGAHLEGPFLEPARAGAIPPAYLLPASREHAAGLLASAPELVRLMTVAPSLPGALELIAFLAAAGIVVSIGHTAADYAHTLRAVEAGARHVTHLFNAMNGLHHRAPGVIGVALGDPRLTVELIADGVHLHPAVLALAIRAKGPGSVALVSDAVGPAGLPAGAYRWLDRAVESDGEAVRLSDGTLAGSLGTLDVALRTVIRLAGCSLVDAALMVATVPARILGVRGKGRIAPGLDADLTAIDDQGRVRLTVVGGKIAYDGR